MWILLAITGFSISEYISTEKGCMVTYIIYAVSLSLLLPAFLGGYIISYDEEVFLSSKEKINYKFDYQNYNIIDLNDNKIIDNLQKFKLSFRKNITKEDFISIDETVHKISKKYSINEFLDEQGNHYVFSDDFLNKEYELQAVYFNKNDLSIKSINTKGDKIYNIKENLGDDDFLIQNHTPQ